MNINQIISDFENKISSTKSYISEYLDRSCNEDAKEDKIGLEGFIEGLEYAIEELKEEA